MKNTRICSKCNGSNIIHNTIFFTTKEHKNWFFPDVASGEEVVLSSHNWTRPTYKAFHCAACQKVVIDYAGDNAPK